MMVFVDVIGDGVGSVVDVGKINRVALAAGPVCVVVAVAGVFTATGDADVSVAIVGVSGGCGLEGTTNPPLSIQEQSAAPIDNATPATNTVTRCNTSPFFLM